MNAKFAFKSIGKQIIEFIYFVLLQSNSIMKYIYEGKMYNNSETTSQFMHHPFGEGNLGIFD